MESDKKVRDLYKKSEEKLQNKKDELYNRFIEESEKEQVHTGYEMGLIEYGLDRLYETYDLWLNDLMDNVDASKAIKDNHYKYFGHID